jgi:Spy/CpxP family protein refolding chaperone
MRKTWIKSTVLLLGMSLGATALLAQQTATPAPDATTQSSASSAAKPQLTAEQKKQLRGLRATAHDQAAIIRNDQTLTAEQKQAKLKELRANTRQQMKSVLTPEQQTAFAQRRGTRKAKIVAKLGLTPDQQSKMKALFLSNRQQRETVLKNASLTNEQKQAQLSQIRQASKTQMATILSPQQLVKFQQMRRMRRQHKMG